MTLEQNCDCWAVWNTSLFLLATHILPASPNFGQAKHGQNGPAATDCQQCIFYPICGHHFTHRTHTDISFRFRPGGRRLKNFHFSRNSTAARVFFLPACCGLNFNATDLPHSSFEPLYPKLFRGTPIVDLGPIVWHTAPSKVRKPWNCVRQKTLFWCFLEEKKFSRSNDRLSLIACHTYAESYCSSG